MDDFPGMADGAAEDYEMQSESPFFEVGVLKNVTPDGGVQKKVLVAGAGLQRPQKGDEVKVHYTGTLASDGSKFDSSVDRGDPFTFKLGEGAVIRSWDAGVATMAKGEKCLLVCREDYAYGKSGSPPKIPALATLHFEIELLSWKSESDLSPGADGSIIKTTITEGTGWEKPTLEDDVIVSYTITRDADGATLESAASAERSIAAGPWALPAIRTALLSLKSGERVTLAVKAPNTYDDGPDAGAPVRVDLTLESILKTERVTDDGGVIKKTLASPPEDTYERPNDDAAVAVTGELRVAGGGPVVARWTAASPLSFVTDDGAVPAGLELGVCRMRKGERALITVSPTYAYGAAGHVGALGTVPPGSSVEYDVTLVSLVKAKEQWELNPAEKLAESEKLKGLGNALFKEDKIERAAKKYDRALKLIEYDGGFNDEEKKAAKVTKLAVWSNLAACKLKLKEYARVVELTTKAVDGGGMNVKALFRRAQARVHLDEWDEAEQDFKRCLDIEPDNKSVSAERAKLKKLRVEQDKKEKGMYAKFFAPTKKVAAIENLPAADNAA